MTTDSLAITNCHLPLEGGDTARWDLVIQDGVIARISQHDPSASLGEVAQHIDADGRSVLPGFVDSHVHIPESGIEMLRCDMSACTTRASVLETVRTYVANNPEQEWIVGRGWAGALFIEQPATLDELDQITGSKPAYLNNRDGHSVWVNSEALRRAGITETTLDPAGGIIGRDAGGKLTGILLESAMQLVSDLVPPVTDEELRAGLEAAQKYMLSLGVTAWQDAIVGDFVPTTDIYALYRDSVLDGTLKARVTGSLWWPRDFDENSLDKLIAERDALPEDSRFRCTSVKIMYDGWFSTYSAALSEPYLLGRKDNFGLSFFDTETLAPQIRAIDAAGFDMHFHVVGDRAARECLDMLEEAIRSNPPRDRRHQLAHVWLLDDDTIDRMSSLGIIANLQPFWAQRDSEQVDIIAPALPERLSELQLRFESLRRAGVPLASGSDWPVSSANPIDAIHVAVNREHPADRRGDALLPDEALSLTSALTAATAGSAFAIRREAEIGTIATGMAADIVMLSDNLSEIDNEKIYSVTVAATLIDGRVEYESGK